MLTNGMESSVSSDVFWIFLLGRVISWFAPHGWKRSGIWGSEI